MAKGDDQRVRTAIDQETQRSNNQNQVLFDRFTSQYDNAHNSDVNLRTNLEQNLLNFKPQYNADSYLGAAGYGGSGGGDGGAGGTAFNIARGIDPSKISGMGAEAYGGYRNLAQGLGQNFWNDYNQYKGSLDNAISGYQNFANTGGWSQQDLDAISAQALAPTRQIYQNSQDEAKRLANASGGAGALGASLTRMAREGNQAISDASISNQANMAQLQQQGKLAGLQGLTQAVSQGMNARTAVESLDAQMKSQGLAGMTDIEKARLSAELENQGLIQRGDIAAAQMAESAAGRAASAGASSRAAALQEAMFRAGLDQSANDQYLGAQDSLIKMYGTTPAATALGNESLIKLYDAGNAANLGLINARTAGAQLPGRFQSAMGNISAGMNTIGGIAKGIGGMM